MTLEPKKRKPRDPLGGLDPLEASSRYLAKNRRCTATSKRTGEQCGRMARAGMLVCATHGGSTKASKMAAAKRIAKASGYAADMLVEFMADPTVDVKLRTSIAQDLLDRANVVGKTAIELSVPEWEKRAKAAATTVSVDWSELAELMPARDPNVIDAEIVEDEPRDATLDVSERPDPHREARLAEVIAEVARVRPQPEEAPPWISDESGAQTATRLADEHRKAQYSAEKTSGGLQPRTTRPR